MLSRRWCEMCRRRRYVLAGRRGTSRSLRRCTRPDGEKRAHVQCMKLAWGWSDLGFVRLASVKERAALLPHGVGLERAALYLAHTRT